MARPRQADVCVRRSCRRLETLQVSDGFGSLGGGSEDRLRVVLQDLQPVGEVLRMVRADVLCGAEFGAQHGGADFRDEFLGGVGVALETRLKIAMATLFRAGPVRELMQDDGIVGFVAMLLEVSENTGGDRSAICTKAARVMPSWSAFATLRSNRALGLAVARVGWRRTADTN